MNYLVQVKIYKGEGELQNLLTNKATVYSSQTQLTGAGVKNLVKDRELTSKLKTFEILREEFWYGNKTVADSDLVAEVSGLEIDLYLK
jgi:hypothetical protein